MMNINNHRPASLLPICAKVFENVIFHSLFKDLDENNLLTNNQSEFPLLDSCIHATVIDNARDLQSV